MKKVLIGLVFLFLAVFASMHIELNSHNTNFNKLDAGDENMAHRIFSEKDLLENQNFSKQLDRFRSASFAGTKKNTPVKNTGIANSKKEEDKSKLAKDDRKDKKKKIAKKKTKKDKKQDPENIADEDLDDVDTEELTDTTSEDDNYSYDLTVISQEDLSVDLLKWMELLSSQPSQINLDLFLQAFYQGEIPETAWLSVVDALLAKNTKKLNEACYYLLSKDLKLSHFQRLVQLLKKTTDSKLAIRIDNHLSSDYISQLEGLNTLKRALDSKQDELTRIYSAKILLQGIKVEGSKSIENSSRTRGDSPTNSVSSFQSFYRELGLYIQLNIEDLAGNSEAGSYVTELHQNLLDYYPLESSTRGRSRS